eukprot:COSAG06_NODE_13009_length_1303_cov_1.199336_1_plen_74_part_10
MQPVWLCTCSSSLTHDGDEGHAADAVYLALAHAPHAAYLGLRLWLWLHVRASDTNLTPHRSSDGRTSVANGTGS